MSKIGIVAGSFDPITNGHVWLIRKAAEMVEPDGELHVVIGVNSAKKYYFSAEKRHEQIRKVLENSLPASLFKIIHVDLIDMDLLINFARKIGATYIFRGIRNTKDFEYEAEIQNINRDIDDTVETIFFIPPSEFTKVSSSTVRGLVGFNGWETAVSRYVSKSVVEDFKEKLK